MYRTNCFIISSPSTHAHTHHTFSKSCQHRLVVVSLIGRLLCVVILIICRYPGANFIVKKQNNATLDLRYQDTEHTSLEVGDIVERHIQDGDFMLFNRQPSLHKMSIMGHQVGCWVACWVDGWHSASTMRCSARKMQNRFLALVCSG